jgi:hypothetical protein
MKLPFELSKRHKTSTKSNWKKNGLICTDEEFEEIYQQYIYSSHCELCKKKYQTSRHRCMEHCHETGKFRNICCMSCNQRKRDRKTNSNNTSGYQYIIKQKDTTCKQGFTWVFQVTINGKGETKKTSVDLEKVIQFRDKWFEEHPDYFT